MPEVIDLVVDGKAASALAAGWPSVSLREVAGPTTSAGRAVRLKSPAGKLLAHGVADPGHQTVWAVAAREGEDIEEALGARLAAAVKLRKRLFAGASTDAYCLFHGEGDGAAGLVVERFGAFAVLYVYSRALAALSETMARMLLEQEGVEGVVRKFRLKGKDKADEIAEDRFGEEPPDELVVHEEGVPFEVHLKGSLNVGLFTDMREVRRRFARAVPEGTFANLFAYTGAFSVVAARAGTKAVSVDISSGVLGWAEDNFRLSKIDPASHEFSVHDAITFLKLAERRGWVYDSILLDPPSFSESRRGGWVYKRDFPMLLRLALQTVAPGGQLWVTSNMRNMREGALEKWIGLAAGQVRRRIDVLEVFGLPPDRPSPLPYDEARYLEVHALRIW